MMTNWETYVKKLTPYVPGEQPADKNVIKLNTNENPYAPSPRVSEVIASFDAADLKRYPDPLCSGLKSKLAAYHGVDEDMVFVGVGSDDVLAMSFLTFFSEAKKPVLFPDITYSFYDVWCRIFNIDYETIPLREDMSVDTEAFIKSAGGVVIANPNAPTGLSMDHDELVGLIRAHHDEIVIVDEAYVDFGGQSVLPLLSECKNLIVVRTFSKSRALAGSRIGYAIGDAKAISFLQAARDSFNSYTMDMLTQSIGAAAVSDDEYFKEKVAAVISTREASKKRLGELGFSFPDSDANFIFATHERVSAKEIYEKLKDRGIYVRYFDKPRINDHLRISIGTDDQMEQLFSALQDILG